MTRHECLSRVLPSLALGLKPVASVAPASRTVQQSNEAEFLGAELSGSAWPTWFPLEAFRALEEATISVGRVGQFRAVSKS
jgi:hypothetical protein